MQGFLCLSLLCKTFGREAANGTSSTLLTGKLSAQLLYHSLHYFAYCYQIRSCYLEKLEKTHQLYFQNYVTLQSKKNVNKIKFLILRVIEGHKV